MSGKRLKYVLFDLDGTLLPMDQKSFLNAYFGGIARFLAPYGYESEKLTAAIWQGTNRMAHNDGAASNETVFWNEFANIFGENVRADEQKFADFYRTEFDKIQYSCGYTPKAKQTVDEIKKMGYGVALATNPIFPSVATEDRIHWAGFAVSDFEYYTTYENSSYCKPNPKYYESVASILGVSPDECLMVGNDVAEDMPAEELGMKVFLMTEYLLNRDGADISEYPQGGFDELLEYIRSLQ